MCKKLWHCTVARQSVAGAVLAIAIIRSPLLFYNIVFSFSKQEHELNAHASTWLPLPPRRPAVTLTSDFQNLIRSSVGVSGYSP